MTGSLLRRTLTVAAGLVVAVCGGVACAQEKPDEKVILGWGSYWRHYYTVMSPVVKKDGVLEKVKVKAPKNFYGGGGAEVGQWLDFDTPMPPSAWTKVPFEDVDWHRKPLLDPDAPWVGHLALRGKFNVEDPEKAKGMKLTVKYRGGVVVYVNGKEIARGSLAAGAGPRELAQDYPEDDVKQARELKDVAIESGMLHKGVNVIALDVHRSAVPGSWVVDDKGFTEIKGRTCGVLEATLKAAKDDAVTPNVVRPAGVQVWNSSVMTQDLECDYGDPNEPVKAIRIVAPLGGAGSGKVVVGSKQAIKGLKATTTGLTQANGTGRIPESVVRVRYGLRTQHSAAEASGPRTYPVLCCDALDEVAPEEVGVMVPNLATATYADRVAVSGAVVSVWVTVEVPADAKAGEYIGKLSITIPDSVPVVVPLELTVCSWKVVDPKEYATFVEVVESPESLAMAYNAPMWSDEHFKLIGKSLTLLGQLGNKTCYIPLICDTNMGNDETMVRWIKQPDGTYKYDLSIMRKYLDAVQKCQGKPAVVCLYVWDTYLEGGLEGAVSDIMGKGGVEATWVAGREEHRGKGPIVSMLDPGTGKLEKGVLPMYSDLETSRKLWAPLMREITEELKKRGLEKTMMLGIITDVRPTPPVVEHFKAVAPGLPWVCHAHERYQAKIHDAQLGYVSVVAGWGQSQFMIDPSVERVYSWRSEGLKTHNARYIRDFFNPTTWRFLGEMNITGRQRGFSRIGGDFFPVLKNARGQVVGSLSARFPKSSWRMLNIITSILAKGKEGPVPTTRFALMREGLQECEARIVIEKALVDENSRAKLGEEFAGSCQELLDARTRDMFRAVCTLRNGCYSPASWWNVAPLLGSQWYAGSGWQDQTLKLYETAAQVQDKLKTR